MLYLSGVVNQSVRDAAATGRIGVLLTPRTRYRMEGVKVWAMDNGCFTGQYPGDDQYLAFLDRQEPHRSRCLFVAAPDVVGDAQATLARADGMIPRIRAKGWPVALVLQDGMTPEMVPWTAVDWVFVGGSTEFKLGSAARVLIREAQRRGVKVHVGRVNSGRRFRMFAALGCDTADGTCIAFEPERNLSRVLGWTAAASDGRLF